MQITKDIIYIGVEDHKIDLFEGQYKVPDGMRYNSYLIKADKIAVMDTVDANFTDEWLANMEAALDGKTPDYLIVQHVEPDHSANIFAFVEKYPEAKIVGNAKTFTMIKNFYRNVDIDSKMVTVTNGEEFSLGNHELKFVFAPMVHWPEVMITYDMTDEVLFTADGFGTFGTADEDMATWKDEAARYYFGIVGKYGAQVQKLLRDISTFTAEHICALHGPVLNGNLDWYIERYNNWSSYKPEKDGVLIAYTSVYGNTEKAVKLLADKLKEKGCTDVKVMDLARCDMSEAVAEAFLYGKMVLATTTYNGTIFPFMKEFIDHLTERGFKNRTIGIIENGSWASQAGRVMKKMLETSKDITWMENEVKITSSVSEENLDDIDRLAGELLV